MMTTESDHHEVSVPSSIDSPQAKLVHLCLQCSGGETVDELQRRTNLSKLSLYTILRTLRQEGLVRTRDNEYEPV